MRYNESVEKPIFVILNEVKNLVLTRFGDSSLTFGMTSSGVFLRSHNNLKQRPKHFLSFTGLTVAEFDKFVKDNQRKTTRQCSGL